MGDGYYFPQFIGNNEARLRVRGDRRGGKHSLRKRLMFIGGEVRRSCHPIRVLRDVQVQKCCISVKVCSAAAVKGSSGE
jgi:hypothetical protein